MQRKTSSIGFVRNLARVLMSAMLLLVLSACSSDNFPFNPIVKNKVYKPSSLAVISGNDKDASVKLAEFLTKELQGRTTFRVLPQAEVAKRMGNYPPLLAFRTDIKDEDEKPVWLTPAEKAKVSAIQAKLKVDYLFVVWNRNVQRVTVSGQGGSSITDYVYPAGNLIEYPGGAVLASTYSVAGSSHSLLGLFRDADYYIVDALKIAAEEIVDEFIDETKSGK